MPEKLPSDDVYALLMAIEAGRTSLALDGKCPEDAFAGDVSYTTHGEHDGWTLVIFNDCDSFDYVDHVIAADGRQWDFDDGTQEVPWHPASAYRGPGDDVMRDILYHWRGVVPVVGG